MSHIKENLLKISYQINKLDPKVTLIAVSKYKTTEEIIEAIKAGQKTFGENRVQESLEKWPTIKEDYPSIELHLIGALQTNKAKEAVSLYDVIEVVDRPKLAKVLLKEMKKQNKYPDCLIQVNTGEEPQKAGILPKEADTFITKCIDDGLPIKGLMCIPPASHDPIPHFTLLKDICNKHKLSICSMGMSGDYQEAIKSGATHVRVGTAIFGKR